MRFGGRACGGESRGFSRLRRVALERGAVVTYRAAHGTGAAALARVETLPADEMPSPVPAPMASDASRAPRQGRGFRADDAATKEAARKGGLAKAGKSRLAASLGLQGLTTSEAFVPYRRSAETFRRHHCSELASMAGGVCGSGPSSMVASAALQLAASRYLFDLAGASGDPQLFVQAAQLADRSRQSLLTAYEMAVRQAQARPAAPFDIAAALREGG